MKAVEKAIYYSAVTPNYNSITYHYSDLESFSAIIESLKNEIDVISIFAPKDDICYTIFNQLIYSYHDLMLDKVTVLFLVNRQDCAIKLVRSEEIKNDTRVAILKIDSVLSEMPKKSSYLSYPLLLGFGILGGVLATQFLKE